MALSCPVGFDVDTLRKEVREMYSRVAVDPDGDFHFHRGPAYAVSHLGYDGDALGALPPTSTGSFAGVANPHAIGPIAAGETVLDIGCGAGTDLLLAARSVGPGGRAIGVDLNDEMLAVTRRSIDQVGAAHAEARKGDVHQLPVDDGSIDVVISNGVLNLSHDKERAFAEIVRVLKPGGRLQLADIAVMQELSEGIRSDVDLWAA